MLWLVTDNSKKFEECAMILGRHGMRVARMPIAEFEERAVEGLFERDPKLVAVLRETSKLVRKDNGEVIDDFRDPALAVMLVQNVGRLQAWVREADGTIGVRRYESAVEGWLDPVASGEVSDAFGWDAAFRTRALGRSYHELRAAGLKHSARDRVLSQFALDQLYLRERADLNYAPQNQDSTVDFSRDAARFVAEHPWLRGLDRSRPGVGRLIDSVAEDGLFFRSAQNRRERNYWLPGLNAGVPLTAKRDALHEATFLVHDLMHFAQPDLVFTGEVGGEYEVARNVYSAWRMVSEACSLVLADMLFVADVRAAGAEYDFAKRQIFPLYEAVRGRAGDDWLTAMRTLVRANVRYALLGDSSGFEALAPEGDPGGVFADALDRYKQKYEGYFRADHRWTVANFDEMHRRRAVFARWSAMVGERRLASLGLVTVDALVRRLRSEDDGSLDTLEGTVEQVLRVVLDELESRARSGAVERRTEAQRKTRAFSRWVVGQCMMFAAWEFVPRSRPIATAILRAIDDAVIDDAVIERVRARMSDHVAELVAEGMLSEDDRRTYDGVFPLFEPKYVAYDSKADREPLDRVADQCFLRRREGGREPEALDLRAWWACARGVAQRDRLQTLMAAAGVRFHDDEHRFVRAPSARLVAVGGVEIERSFGAGFSVRSSSVGERWFDGVREAQLALMGSGAAMTYLDPRDRGPTALAASSIERGHGSITHLASVTLLVAGFSTAVGNELNGQRDLVHVARVTEARTEAQGDPPLCVLCEEDVALYRSLRSLRRGLVDQLESADDSQEPMLRRESINLSHASAKATMALVTGSLRSWQKLVASIDDEGREEEYRRVLVAINDVLSALHPSLFCASVRYRFRPTWTRRAR
jgi:adenylate kinase